MSKDTPVRKVYRSNIYGRGRRCAKLCPDEAIAQHWQACQLHLNNRQFIWLPPGLNLPYAYRQTGRLCCEVDIYTPLMFRPLVSYRLFRGNAILQMEYRWGLRHYFTECKYKWYDTSLNVCRKETMKNVRGIITRIYFENNQCTRNTVMHTISRSPTSVSLSYQQFNLKFWKIWYQNTPI